MTITSDLRLRIIAALLVVAAILFVIGVAAEPDNGTHTDEPRGEAAEHSEAGETAEARASEASEGTEAAEGGEERVLGLDLESPGPIAVGLVLSAVLAAVVLWRPDRRALVVIAVVTAAFAVLDIGEVGHQLDEDRAGLALLAATIALLHTATAGLAVWRSRPERRRADPPERPDPGGGGRGPHCERVG